MISRYLLDDSVFIQASKIPLDVGKDFFFCLVFQYDFASEGGICETALYLVFDVARMTAYQRLKAVFIAKLRTRVAHEVEHGEMVFAFMQTQASAKLLKEHRGALRRAEEENRVDFRDVHALIKRSTTKR